MAKIDFKAANAAFRALPKKDKRIVIAKDTILQLHTEAFVAMSGTYFDMELKTTDTCDLQQILHEKKTTCEVCARGAVFASAVRLSDGVHLDYVLSDSDYEELSPGDFSFDEKETQSFDIDQLLLMEVAFETHKGRGRFNPDDYGEGTRRQAAKFGYRYREDKDRMNAIMQNVIDNDGTFKPEILTQPLTRTEFYARYKTKA